MSPKAVTRRHKVLDRDTEAARVNYIESKECPACSGPSGQQCQEHKTAYFVWNSLYQERHLFEMTHGIERSP